MRVLVQSVVIAALVVVAAPAAHASVAPPRVSGSVTGTGKQGDVLIFRVAATDRSGFGHLDTIRIALQLHSVILDEFTYDRTHNAIASSTSLPVPAGTRATLDGTFLLVDARQVEIRSGGNSLAVTLRARVLQDIPKGSAFSLGASDDVNLVTWVTRGVTIPTPSGGGFSWGTLGLAVAAALFLGGFVGNLFASRHAAGAAPKVDVYAMVDKELRKQPVKA